MSREACLWGCERWRPDKRVQFSNPLDPAKFELLASIGSGTYGDVVKVRHPQHREPLAIKRLRKGDCVNGRAVCYASALGETEVFLRMHANPYFPTLYGSFEDDTCRYLVMECGGPSFYDGDVVCNAANGLKYGRQLVSAIESLHRAHIVHLDLKPHNIILGADGLLRVVDYGFSYIFRPTCPLEWREWHTQCASGDFSLWPEPFNPDTLDYRGGTREYNSPMVLAQRRYSYCADLWTTGILLHMWIIGEGPNLDNGFYTPPEDLSVVEFDFFRRIFCLVPGSRFETWAQVRAHRLWTEIY